MHRTLHKEIRMMIVDWMQNHIWVVGMQNHLWVVGMLNHIWVVGIGRKQIHLGLFVGVDGTLHKEVQVLFVHQN